MKTRLLAGLALALLGLPALAQTPDEEAEKLIGEKCRLEPPAYRIQGECSPARFRAYEPNYVVYKWTRDDESAMRAHFSFRYLLFTADCVGAYRRGRADQNRDQALKNLRECFDADNHEWYLMYTGEFDFYWGTRASSPVINRINNPGFHYRQYKPGSRFEWWDVGFEHRSNGQSTDAKAEVVTPTGTVRAAQLAYDRGDHAYFDSISRNTNYFTAETHYRFNDYFDLYARIKWLYLGNETDITWGPLADQNVKMRHYDRFRFILNYTFDGQRKDRTRGEQPYVFAEWTVGDQLVRTDSLNAGVYLPIQTRNGRIPLFARLHLGPLETLSNYTKSQASFGLGLMFIE